jgi:hypothetical protein
MASLLRGGTEIARRCDPRARDLQFRPGRLAALRGHHDAARQAA